MKNATARNAKIISTHSLLAAVVTNPWFVSLVADLYNIYTGAAQDGSFVGSSAHSALAFMSTFFLIVSIASSLVWLLMQRHRLTS